MEAEICCCVASSQLLNCVDHMRRGQNEIKCFRKRESSCSWDTMATQKHRFCSVWPTLQCLANAASSTERLNSAAHQDGHRIPLRLLPYLSHAGSNREKNTPIIIQKESYLQLSPTLHKTINNKSKS